MAFTFKLERRAIDVVFHACPVVVLPALDPRRRLSGSSRTPLYAGNRVR